MSDSIALSEKYGVNPSMDCCFWCGEPKGVALLGKLKGDVEAPRKVVTSYEPCDKCKEIFDKGIHVIGVSHDPVLKGMPSIGKDENGEDLYPDMTYFVAREEFVHRIYEDNPEAIKGVLKTRKLLMPSRIVHEVIRQNQQEDLKDEGSESWISDPDTSDSN